MNLITGFDHPHFFYAFAALAVLLALYWFYRRSARKQVPAIFLWDRPESTPESGSRRQFRRLPLSFFLEALALILLVLAATAPFRMANEAFPALAVVLDNSFSMRAEGTDGAIRLAHKLVEENPGKYFMPDQFSNAGNYQAHYENTAIEIWQQTEGEIDYLVSALGTSGTIMGVSRFLKKMQPNIKVVSAHPVKGHYIQGLKNMDEAIVPAIYDPLHIDMQVMVESEEAIAMAREIIAKEGIFAGMSSGAAMLAALRTAERIDAGNIVVIFPDRAEKYLSTSMFDDLADD